MPLLPSTIRDQNLVHDQIYRVAHNMSLYTRVQVIDSQSQQSLFIIHLPKTSTIFTLATMIESQFTLQFGDETIQDSIRRFLVKESEYPFTNEFVPLVCGKLLFKGKELDFDNTVGSILPSDAQVTPINYFLPSVLNSLPTDSNGNFNQLLHYKGFATHFMKFSREVCQLDLLSFWYEVEAFKFCLTNHSDELMKRATYIYNTFVALDAPLKLNLPSGLIENIQFPFQKEPIDKLSKSFDTLQNHVYITLILSYRDNFINSEYFINYQSDHSNDHSNDHYIMDHYTPDKELVNHPYRHNELIAIKGRDWGLEKLLERILNQIFPNLSLDGYIQESRLKKSPAMSTQSYRTRRNRVHKFFGEAPDPKLLSCNDSPSDSDEIESTEPRPSKSKDVRQILGAEAPKITIPKLTEGQFNSNYVSPKYSKPQRNSKDRQVLSRRLRKLKSMLGDNVDCDKLTSLDSTGSDSSSLATLSSDESNPSTSTTTTPPETSTSLRQFKKLCNILGSRDGLYSLSGEAPISHIVPRTSYPNSLPHSPVIRTRAEAARSRDKLCTVLGERPQFKLSPTSSIANSTTDLDSSLSIDPLSPHWLRHHQSSDPEAPNPETILSRQRLTKLQKLLGDDLKHDPEAVTKSRHSPTPPKLQIRRAISNIGPLPTEF